VLYYALQQVMLAIQGSQNAAMLFWFIYLAFGLYFIVVMQISVVQTYLQLCYEDYQWWWRSWSLGAMPALSTFVLCVGHLFFSVRVTHYTSFIIYIVFSLAVSVFVGLVSGVTAWIASFIFVNRIYSGGKHA
jgi:transmembrane 9 superfamily protein 2/4